MKANILHLARLLEKRYGVPQRIKADAEGAVHFQQEPTNPLMGELVGTILSQNTTDINSSRAFAALKAAFPTWEKVLAAPAAHLARAIRSGGLAQQKAARIKKILAELKRSRGSLDLSFIAEMPDGEAMAYLQSFKGVGPKTAACVLMFGLGRDLCPVDTHIHRILNRLGTVSTKTDAETFAAFAPMIPKGKAYSLHINLIRLGKSICKARQPKCLECPLADGCRFAAEAR